MSDTNTKKKKRFNGVVVSDKMDKTAIVRVDRYVKHPKYLKYIEKSSTFHVHNPDNEYTEGDKVVIEETAPVSKTKRYVITQRRENGSA